MILLWAVILVLFLKYLWDQRKFYWASLHMEGPIALPFIGNGLLALENDFFKLLRVLKKKYTKPLLRLWLGPKLFVVTTHSEMIETILTHPNCVEKGQLYNFSKDLFGPYSLVNLNHAKWKVHRKLLNPLFTHSAIKSNLISINENCENFVKILENIADGKELNICSYLLEYVFGVVFDITIKSSTMEKKKVLNFIHECLEIMAIRMFKIWLHPEILYKFTNYYRLQKKATNSVRNAFKRILCEKKSMFNEKTSLEYVLVDEIIEFQNNGLFSDDEAIDELKTSFLAGYETTGTHIAFACLALAMYPEYQQRLYEEIQANFPEPNSFISLDDLNKLSYLDMFVKEVLRLFPSVPVISRRVTDDILLGDTQIPVGTELVISIFNAHRDKEFCKNIENPEEFNPDNFKQEKVDERHRYGYIPFSGGRRNCIGMSYAIILSKLTLIRIVRNFRLSTSLKMKDLEFQISLTLNLVNKHMICLHKRTN